ncbi:hypothetical protein SK128_023138 [Halocaridina rubra]|uniref:Uncharacterized protein n=1 Tax=Halocaridina rubra TaxID=373956 RepID=A0AAN9ADL7_HALRR
MSLCIPPITETSIVELIKGVAMQGYSVFSTILERVTTLSAECGSRWQPLIVEISEHQNAQRAKFREKIESIQLQLTSPTLESRKLHPPTPSTISEITSTMLTITDQVVLIKILIAKVISEWNLKVQDLLQLRKKEERLEKAKVMGATMSGGGGLPRQSTSGSISTSSVASALANTSTGEMYSAVSQRQGVDTASLASSAALTGVSTDSLSLSASLSDIPGHENQKNISGECAEDVGEKENYCNEECAGKLPPEEHIDQKKPSEDTKESTSALSLSSASSEVLNSWENESDVSGALQAGLSSQPPDVSSGLHRRQASDSCDGLVSGFSALSESPGRGHERSLSDGGGQTSISRETVDRGAERRIAASAVKNIISTLWSSSGNLVVEVSVTTHSVGYKRAFAMYTCF